MEGYLAASQVQGLQVGHEHSEAIEKCVGEVAIVDDSQVLQAFQCSPQQLLVITGGQNFVGHEQVSTTDQSKASQLRQVLDCVQEMSSFHFRIDNLQLPDLIVEQLPKFTAISHLCVINGHCLIRLKALQECGQGFSGVREQGHFLEDNPTTQQELHCIEPPTTDQTRLQLVCIVQVVEYLD